MAEEEFVGPKQEPHPWEGWDDATRAQMDKALATADLAKNYRESGSFAQPGARDAYAQVAGVGGLHPDAATLLARYRMAKQGALDIPRGERSPAPTDEQINARAKEFLAADKNRRAQMQAEDKAAIARSAEGYFDSIAAKPRAEPLFSKGRVNLPDKKIGGADMPKASPADALAASRAKVKG